MKLKNQICNAFTLIELLVVIAIISMLASLLLPALKNAKDFAKESLCISQLKQQMTQIASYSVDSNSYVPPERLCENCGWWCTVLQNDGHHPVGLGMLDPVYNPEQGVPFQLIFACPCDSAVKESRMKPFWGQPLGSTISYNTTLGWKVYASSSDPDFLKRNSQIRSRGRNRLGLTKEPEKAWMSMCTWQHGSPALLDDSNSLKGRRAPILYFDGHVSSLNYFRVRERIIMAGLVPNWWDVYVAQWYKASSPGYWDINDNW